MGIDYYQCFLCKYCGPEACFQKEVYTPHEDINYCEECVEKYFIETPMNYWIKDNNGTVSRVEHKDLKEKLSENCKWCYSIESTPPEPEDVTAGSESLCIERKIYFPKHEEWKKRELGNIFFQLIFSN